MSRYRKVSIAIWNDKKFTQMSDDGQFVFLFLLTHPFMTGMGVMRASVPGLAAEKKWPLPRFEKAIGESFDRDMIKYDPEALCVSIPKFPFHNKPESPNVVTGWSKNLDSIPECGLRDECICTLHQVCIGLGEGFANAFTKGFGEVFAKGIANQEQEQEQEQEQDNTLLPGQDQTTEPMSAKAQQCPQLEIVGLFNDILGDKLPSVTPKLWTKARRKILTDRWKEDPERQNLDWWKKFFGGVKSCPYLLGEVNNWRANIDWLIKSKNIKKVLEGNYKDHNPPQKKIVPQNVREAQTAMNSSIASVLLEKKRARKQGEVGNECNVPGSRGRSCKLEHQVP